MRLRNCSLWLTKCSRLFATLTLSSFQQSLKRPWVQKKPGTKRNSYSNQFWKRRARNTPSTLEEVLSTGQNWTSSSLILSDENGRVQLSNLISTCRKDLRWNISDRMEKLIGQ